MDLRGVGAGRTGIEFPSALRNLAALKGQGLTTLASLVQSDDAITTILRGMSEMEFASLLKLIEHMPPSDNTVRVETLLRETVSAAAEGKAPEAPVKMAELAALDPQRAESFGAESSLTSVHADAREMLFRLTSLAQLDAVSRLGQASRLLQAEGSRELMVQEIKPKIIILIAERLLEAGGYANFIRSAEFSQVAISQMTTNVYGLASTADALSPAEEDRIATGFGVDVIGPRHKWVPRLRRLWLRAPLLILLLVWLAVGLVAGAVSVLLRIGLPQFWEAWGMGFLALVLFGFYARVRNLRR